MLPHVTPSNDRNTVVELRPAAAMEREIDSLSLLRGAREIVIRHGDQAYRLRHTRNGKLILTK